MQGKGSSQRLFKCVTFDLRKSRIVSPPDVSLSLPVLLYPGPPGTQGAVAGVVCPPKSATEGRVFRSASQALVDPQRGIRKSHRSFF